MQATLSPADRRSALSWARQAIAAALRGEVPQRPAQISRVLGAPCAAFVTVYCRGELRGCVGTLDTESSFFDVVARLARSAALDDHRFAPLTVEELEETRIEISRLSPLQSAAIEDIDVGRHGVSLEHGDKRAVFLPKVASEHGWERSTLLTELCRKAYLPDDAWRSASTRLFTFTAEVFDEGGDGGLGA